ncbi:MAG TPA: SET domain-containing protein-lysine N-methyltransferase [Magnetospirillaceae bacterium]|jgi:hypothetical protein
MIHPDTELRFIDDTVGFGVFATAPIPRGTIVWVLCRFDIVLTPDDVRNLPAAYRPIVETYAYGNPDGNRVLCWDHGRSVNHSCAPAMRGLGTQMEIAVRDIAAGAQLTCEYGSLNLTYDLQCRCGAPNCRGTIKPDDVLRLGEQWDREVAEALPFAAKVPQPLLDFARDTCEFWDWANGKTAVPSHRSNHVGAASNI